MGGSPRTSDDTGAPPRDGLTLHRGVAQAGCGGCARVDAGPGRRVARAPAARMRGRRRATHAGAPARHRARRARGIRPSSDTKRASRRARAATGRALSLCARRSVALAFRDRGRGPAATRGGAVRARSSLQRVAHPRTGRVRGDTRARRGHRRRARERHRFAPRAGGALLFARRGARHPGAIGRRAPSTLPSLLDAQRGGAQGPRRRHHDLAPHLRVSAPRRR